MLRKKANVAVALVLSLSSACGSVTGSNDGGRGTGGAAGSDATGTGGHGGTTGGAGGHAGGAGGPATGGHGGSAGGGGSGGGTGGSAGRGGSGGAGGASPCQAVLALDRSCTTASDCFAAVHQSNCCGQRTFIGLSSSVQAQYQSLESKCDATYPLCGCAEGQPTTDDGSKVQFNATPSVACVQGVCTTFATECGKPCAQGTTCFSCSNRALLFAACTNACTTSADCHDPTLPLCQLGNTGNTPGMYCTAAGVACDTK